MFMGEIEGLYMWKGLIFHLHKCCDFYSTHFWVVTWIPATTRYGLLCRCGTWVFCQILIWIEWLFLRHLEQILLQRLSDGVLKQDRLCGVAQNEAGFFCVASNSHLGKSSFIAMKMLLVNIKKHGQGSKQFFLNAGQQKSVWQWKVFELLKFFGFFFSFTSVHLWSPSEVYSIRLEYLK